MIQAQEHLGTFGARKKKRGFAQPGLFKSFLKALRVTITLKAAHIAPVEIPYCLGAKLKGKARRRRPKRKRGRLLYFMVSVRGVHTLETDLLEGGVVTKKPTTPEDTTEDTRKQGGTNTQYNRQTTALRSHRPLAGGCRRGMQLQCNVVWICSSLTLANARKTFQTARFVLFEKTRENGAKSRAPRHFLNLLADEAKGRKEPITSPESSSCCWSRHGSSIGTAHERPALLRHLRRRCSSSRTERSLKRG